MNLVSGNPNPIDRLNGPDLLTSRPDVLRNSRLQLNNLGEGINRATEMFSRLLGEVNKAVGRYGSVQLENLSQMPIFPEPIKALMGMLSRSPEAMAAQLNRVFNNHRDARSVPGIEGRVWVSAENPEQRPQLTQLSQEVARLRQNGTNAVTLGRFFAELGASFATEQSPSLGSVVERSRTIVNRLLGAPPAPAPVPAPAPAPAPAPEIRTLAENEELRAGDKRTVPVRFTDELTIDGQPGKLAASTEGTVTIRGLKFTRTGTEDKVTVEVTAAAPVGDHRLKFAGETKILKVKAPN